MRYCYVKAAPYTPTVVPISIRKSIPFLIMSMGIFLITWAAWPILSFRLRYSHLYENQGVISPLPAQLFADGSGVSQALGVSAIDYTKAYNWFPTHPQNKGVSTVDSYQLSIRKLKISNAFVTIGSNDLDKSLIHYGGTGVPGEYGNAVLFGHSVLPQFYDPKDYMTIFSNLPTLKPGDEIDVTYDNVNYTYIVEKMRVTDPEDVSGLEQRYDDSYLTMVTCVPPGTYLKRLWVTTRIKKT